jgi:hypothetical protein
VFAKLARRLEHEGIGDVEHRLRGAIVLRQRNDLGIGVETLRECQNILDGRGTE